MKRIKGLKIVALLAALMMIVLCLGGCSVEVVDNVTTLKDHAFYPSDFPNVTVGKIVSKYVSSPKWNESKSGGETYVTVTGHIEGFVDDLSMKFSVTDDPSDKKSVTLDLVSLNLDGESCTERERYNFLYNLCNAYYDGASDFGDWVNDNL